MQKWCFILSLAMLTLFYAVCLSERIFRNLGETGQWRLRILKFIFLVLSGGTLLFGWQQDVSLQGVLESLYGAVKLFFADGKLYEISHAPLSANTWQAMVYFGLYYLICGIAVYCTATAVISLFKNFAALRELKRRGRHKNLCVFSELNERTLAIAESILENTKNSCPVRNDANEEDRGFFTLLPQTMDHATRKLAFVFCDVFEQHAEHSFELTERARKLGALCLKNDITEVHARLRRAGCYRGSKKRLTRFFLAGTDEAENVRQAIVIAAAEQEAANDNRRIKNLAVFVFANGEVNGEAIDSLNERGEKIATFFVRRLDPALMLAYDILADKENYLVTPADPEKHLQVLVVGMGQYGLAITKMLCWFYQRRTGGITVHVVDRERGIADHISAVCPELVNYTSPKKPTEDMQLSLVIHEGVDLFSDTFCSLIKTSLADIDAAFVTLGDDDSNAEAATLIRRTLDRAHYDDIIAAYTAGTDGTPLEASRYITVAKDEKGELTHKDLTRIFAVVHSDKRCKNFAKSSQYNIQFVGNDSAIYDYRNIYNHQMEVAAIRKHKEQKKCSYRKAVNAYNASEYNRLSSLASAYYFRLYQHLYGETAVVVADSTEKAEKATRAPELEALLRTENKRWNAYMRSGGYICMNDSLSREQRDAMFRQGGLIPARRWTRGKWHNSITSFSRLGDEEQENNTFKINLDSSPAVGIDHTKE